MQSHVRILGVLFIVFGVLTACIGLLVFAIIGGAGIVSQDQTAMLVTGIVGAAIAAFLVILAIPMIVTGVALPRYRGWARILALVIAAFNILSFPFGTALAVYAFWVLLNDETSRLFQDPPAAQSAMVYPQH